MNRKSMLYLSFVFLISVINLWGCPKKTEVTTVPIPAQTEKVAATSAPVTEATTTETKVEGLNKMDKVEAEGLKPVYFDSDKSSIRDDAKEVLKANAAWLKANPKAKVKIEGNCDERENSKALSKRRAASAKKYLTEMGISRHRISIASYGKTKSVCSEQDETCWQKNRRDDFVIIEK